MSILRDDIEYLVHCEEDGEIIWPLSKIHWHYMWARQSLTHYSTRSMVYNPISKRYGIQLKNPKKNDSSTWWKRDMWVAWHNCYVQEDWMWRRLDFDENLSKESEEEIWLDLKMYGDLNEFVNIWKNLTQDSIWYIFDRFHYKTDINNEYVGLWLILTLRNNLQFTDNEVVDFQRLSERVDYFFGGEWKKML